MDGVHRRLHVVDRALPWPPDLIVRSRIHATAGESRAGAPARAGATAARGGAEGGRERRSHSRRCLHLHPSRRPRAQVAASAARAAAVAALIGA
ncbi:hypothetical protein E2562_038892 [Oryza meyeriana var. granulata]|uniref:Uncharacterized protein n=1 Tax=Oryza meyeriana var. granulata TaxID=110450 RepID=A0A6G1EUE5_9ORYZ|nr:hypothetical protein E2562_038892 [Oryza meyeriana var. granulata]